MRLLIVSDIHANIAALERIPMEGTDKIIFLGDAVDYGPRPAECVAWVHDYAAIAVRGNHDNAVGNNADPRCSPAYREMALATWELHRRLLGPEDKAFLQQLPLEAYFEFGGAQFYAVHAAPSDPLFQYLPPDITDADLAAELTHVEADVVLMGHTHTPFARRAGGKMVMNPGSVGQPKGGDPRAAYAVWEDGEVFLRRVAYPVEETVRQLEEQPLPVEVLRDLVHVLRTGDVTRDHAGKRKTA
jgi:putative phosphoesterase